MRLDDLRGKRVAVWGTGREGVAAVRAIARVGPAGLVVVQDRVTASARPWAGEPAALAPLKVGEEAHRALGEAQVVVRSPVIGETHPWVRELRAAGTTITGGTALWMADNAARTIGVTGSKGKSTTSTLISLLLAGVGRPNALGGNIGIPVLDLPPAERYVLELSMYQCADLRHSPRVVALTSLVPEHLDWAGGEEAYYRFKLNIADHAPGTVVFTVDDPRLRAAMAARPGVTAVGAGAPDGFHVGTGPDGERWLFAGDAPLFPRAALPPRGRHNEANLCVALAAIAADGVDCVAERGRLADALAGYPALPHRLTEIPDPSGLTFVDDSLATIPQATIAAVEAYADRPLTVIVGGEDRGVDYAPLRDFLAGSGVAATFIGIPDSGSMIVGLLKEVPTVTAYEAEDLAAAVRLARRHTAPGGAVLLSPAAASYGRFDNHEHRSRVFRAAIEATRQ